MAKYAAVHMVFNHLDQIAPYLRPQADKVCNDIAVGVRNYAAASMEGPKHGRTYRRGKIGRKMTKSLQGHGLRTYTTQGGTKMAIVGAKIHVASAPGEAPAVDYGHLVNSIKVHKVHDLLWYVTVGAAYGYILEFGSVKMAARPFMRPAAKAYFQTFVNRIKALKVAP